MGAFDALSGFSGALQDTPEHPRMARNLDADHESEPSTGKPRAQVRPQPLDPPIRTKLEYHRIVNPERTQARASDHEASIAIPDLLAPAQIGQTAVDRREQQSQVPLAANHTPREQRRDKLGVWCQRVYEPV